MFCACGDKNGNENPGGDDSSVKTVKASGVTEISDASQVTYVKAVIPDPDDDGSDPQVIAVAPYADQGFTLELPESYPTGYLYSVDVYEADGVTITNPDARMGSVYLEGHTSGSQTWSESEYKGDFDYVNADYTYGAYYYYFDSDVTITGSGTDEDGWTYNYNISAKKGWNLIYYYDDETDETFGETTVKPSAVILAWEFEDWR